MAPHDGRLNLCTGLFTDDQRALTWTQALADASLSRDDVWAYKNAITDFALAYQSSTDIKFFFNGSATRFTQSGAIYTAPSSAMYLTTNGTIVNATAANLKIVLEKRPDCGSNVFVVTEAKTPSDDLVYTWSGNCRLTTVINVNLPSTDPGYKTAYYYSASGSLEEIKIGPSALPASRTTGTTFITNYDVMSGLTSIDSVGPCGLLDDRNTCLNTAVYRDFNSTPLLISRITAVKNAVTGVSLYSQSTVVSRASDGVVNGISSPISGTSWEQSSYTYTPHSTSVCRSGFKTCELYSWRLAGLPGELLRVLTKLGSEYFEVIHNDDRANNILRKVSVSDRSAANPTIDVVRLSHDGKRNTTLIEEMQFGMNAFKTTREAGVADADLGLFAWIRDPIAKKKTTYSYVTVDDFTLLASNFDTLFDGTSAPLILPARSYTYTINHGVHVQAEKVGGHTVASHSFTSGGEYSGTNYYTGSSTSVTRDGAESFLVNSIAQTDAKTGVTSSQSVLARNATNLSPTSTEVSYASQVVGECIENPASGVVSCDKKSLAGVTLSSSSHVEPTLNNGLTGGVTYTSSLTAETAATTSTLGLNAQGVLTSGNQSASLSGATRTSSWSSTQDTTMPLQSMCSPINCQGAVAAGLAGSMADGCGGIVSCM